MKKERVTGKAGINYKRTLDAVFFMVNAFFCMAPQIPGIRSEVQEQNMKEKVMKEKDMKELYTGMI